MISVTPQGEKDDYASAVITEKRLSNTKDFLTSYLRFLRICKKINFKMERERNYEFTAKDLL